MNFTPNLVVGAVITLVGIALTLDRLDLADAGALFRFWPVALILFGASVVAQALRPETGAQSGERQRPVISSGLIIMMAMLWLLASRGGQSGVNRMSDSTEATVTLVAVMGRSDQINHATEFRHGSMTSIMGRSQLDLRDARLAAGEEVVVDVFGLMGAVQIVVPEGWIVDIQTTPVMGGVRDRRGASATAPGERRSGGARRTEPPPATQVNPPDATAVPSAPGTTAPRLVVRGFVMMGALEIRS